MRRVLILTALLLVPGSLRAQTCGTPLAGTCSISGLNISITFSRVFELELSDITTPLTVPTPADFDAGYAATTGPVLTVASNANWNVAVSSATNLWSASNTGTEAARTTKPASELGWATSAGGPFTPMSTTPATILSGTPSSATVIPLFYRTDYAWGLDTPGNYSIQLIFTLTAP